jgi:MraZ protein
MIFTGHAELTIDAKQRVAIPAKYRAKLTPESDGSAWYCVPYGEKKLVLYTEKRFEEIAEQRDFKLMPDPVESELASKFFGMCERIDPDAAGRIVIPRLHREMAELGDDVVMIGCGKYIEIWDRKVWTETYLPGAKQLQSRVAEISDRSNKDAKPGNN